MKLLKAMKEHDALVKKIVDSGCKKPAKKQKEEKSNGYTVWSE